MVFMYVKNTFIEIAHDDGEIPSSSRLPAVTAKRSSSTPPHISAEMEGNRFDLKPKAEYLSAADICATPCIFSPRSDYSTAASSERDGKTLPGCAPLSSDSDTASSSPAFSTRSPHLDQVALDAAVAAAEQESAQRETQDPQDCISTGDLKDFCINLNKDESQGTPLGIDVDRSDGITLFIRTVKEGLVAEWNKKHPDMQVLEGDRIVKVNSISGSALELLRECRRRNNLQMRVLRNARPELLAALVAAFCTAQSVLTAGKAVPAAGASSSGMVPPPPASEAGNQRRSRGRKMEKGRGFRPDVAADASKVAAFKQAPAMPTSHMQPAQALSSTFSFMDNSTIACSEVSAILRSVAGTLTFNPKVQSVHVFQGAMGSSSAINVELPSSHEHNDVQGIAALTKSTLLEATAQSHNTYIVGYSGTPFCAVGELSFRCTIARVPDDTNACWDFYQKGFCPRPSSCRWCHPDTSNLMTVWVNFKL